MRSIWKGVISFGLVSIPIRLYPAAQERDVSFHQVRRSDGARVRYRRVAATDGEEVAYADIAKGYELPDGEMVVLTDDDFTNLPLTTSRSINVLGFVPLEQVDPIYFAKSYYLEPDRTGLKPYVLLRDALAGSGRVALVKIALRQREQLATLRVRDDVFVLETMLWPDEVREPEFDVLDEQVDVRPQELAMASSLIDTLAADFDPTKFRDGYREALQAVIDAKIAGRDVVAPPSEQPGVDAAGDLMAALRASIEAARTGRDGQSSGSARAAPAEAGSARAGAGSARAGARKGQPSRSRKEKADTAADEVVSSRPTRRSA
ncbi:MULTISPECIES: Ku protein [unclassified Parafrankia]|uniref:non-homologous end joining protein Ku n=1 Tax=unclassified Parafrankia TaxID=2994368 RepID=UPI000DD4384F|nr:MULTISPECIES: Ku protein [unclassified Parafrankia]TCJ40344.1 Ku protein [Parafrankia sp. BMG5.11]